MRSDRIRKGAIVPMASTLESGCTLSAREPILRSQCLVTVKAKMGELIPDFWRVKLACKTICYHQNEFKQLRRLRSRPFSRYPQIETDRSRNGVETDREKNSAPRALSACQKTHRFARSPLSENEREREFQIIVPSLSIDTSNSFFSHFYIFDSSPLL